MQPTPLAPFQLGEYLTDDSSVGKHLSYVGDTFWMKDKDPGGGRQQGNVRGNRLKLMLCLRNTSAINLKPRQLVTFDTGGGVAYQTNAISYTGTAAGLHCAPVDDNIIAAGVPQYAVFYVCICGLNEVITEAADSSADITVGQMLISSGAGTTLESAGSTAGRVLGLVEGSTDITAAYIPNVFGRALTAAVTDDNSTAILANCMVRL